MLAIVIPYYKINFFEATLDSLANQTNKQFKVYIGDDASLENPKELLDEYQGQFDFEYHRFDENLGGKSLVQQWNRCLALCEDVEWIIILGDDDVLESNCVNAFYSNLKEINDLDIKVIRFATRVIDGNGKHISKIHIHPELENSTHFLARKLNGGTRSSLSEYVFRKKKMDEVKFKDFPLAWHSDDLAMLEFSDFKNIYTINSSLVYVRSSGLNISSKIDNLSLKNKASFQYYYYLLKKRKNFFHENFYDKLYFQFEKTILNDKKNIFFIFSITKLYFSNAEFKRYVFFVIKYFKLVCFSIVNKKR